MQPHVEGERIAERVPADLLRGAGQADQTGDAAEDSRRRRAEETQRTGCGETETGGDIDTCDQSGQQAGAVIGAGTIEFGQQDGNEGRQRMHHRGFVHAVEFLVVNLERVDERRLWRGKLHTRPSQHAASASVVSHLAGPAAPSLGRLRQAVGMRSPGAGEPDRDAVMQEQPGRSHRRRRDHVRPQRAGMTQDSLVCGQIHGRFTGGGSRSADRPNRPCAEHDSRSGRCTRVRRKLGRASVCWQVISRLSLPGYAAGRFYVSCIRLRCYRRGDCSVSNHVRPAQGYPWRHPGKGQGNARRW
jgi:hypothetical protein